MTSRLLHRAILLSIAIVFVAATGTAVAAQHYLITSTKQISPHVLKKLHGRTGPAGATGATGAAGLGLTADQTLPSGRTETGVFAGSGSVGEFVRIAIEFRPKLAADLAVGSVHYVTTPTAACPGNATTPSAAPGQLCVYQGSASSASYSAILRPDGTELGATELGAVIAFDPTGTTGRAWGTWAVTAP